MLVLTVLAGCGRVAFDSGERDAGSATDSSADARLCTFGACSTPAIVPGPVNSGDTDWSPTISGDTLVLVFESNRSGNADLYEAQRTTTAEPFGAPRALDTLNTGAVEGAAHLLADGLSMYFSTDRLATGRQVFKASRGSIAADWDPPSEVSSLRGIDISGPSVTADLQEMVYSYALPLEEDIGRAVLVGGEYVDQGPFPELNSSSLDGWPTISADGLTIYYESTRTGDYELYSATRPTRSAPFAPPELMSFTSPSFNEADPEISKDGQFLVFTSDGPVQPGNFNLYMVTRPCL